MKKGFKFLLMLLFLVVVSLNVFSATGDVYISPNNPVVGDVLTCGIEGATNNYNYYWYVNNVKVSSSYGKTSQLNTNNLNGGDVVGCDVYIPNINAYVGSASVQLKEAYNDVPVNVILNVNPSQGDAPLTISYNCDATGNKPISYTVDFGDGTRSNNNIGSHTYNNPGNYTVSCSAVDNDGDFDSDQEIVTVKQPYGDIPAEVIAELHYSYVSNDKANVYGACNFYGNAPYTYIVYYDGQQIDSGVTMNNRINYTFTNQNVGVHELKCELFDYDNDYAEDTIRVNITPQDIDFTGINFNINPKEGDAPLTVNYDCNAVGGNNPISYRVDFGDGTTSNDNVGSHTYNNPGNYTVSCSAVDNDGDSISASDNVVVKEPYNDIPAKATLLMKAVNGTWPYAPLTVEVNCFLDGNRPYNATLDFGDGTTQFFENRFSSVIRVNHIYNNPGNYNVVCSIVDYDGDTAFDQKNFTLNERPQNLSWSVTAYPTEGESPLLVFFKANTSDYNNIEVNWDFGDGHYAVGNNVKHLFVKPGVYIVKAYFYDNFGVYHEYTLTIKVNEKTPQKEKVDYNKFRIKHLVAYSGYNSILVSVTAENFVGEDLDEVTISAYFPMSGYEFTRKADIKNHDWRTVNFEIPKLYGEEIVIIKAYNDKVYDSKKSFLI